MLSQCNVFYVSHPAAGHRRYLLVIMIEVYEAMHGCVVTLWLMSVKYAAWLLAQYCVVYSVDCMCVCIFFTDI